VNPPSFRVPAESRLTMLDKRYSTRDSNSDVSCDEIYANYENWIRDYIKPLHDGPFWRGFRYAQASHKYFEHGDNFV
jgi:hypothetical protein